MNGRVSGVRFLAAMATVLVTLPSAHAESGTFTVTAGSSEIVFDEYSGVPERWTVCAPHCEDKSARRAVLFDKGDGYLRINPAVPGDAFATTVEERDDSVVVSSSAGPANYTWRIARDNPFVTFEGVGGIELEFATGTSFVPAQLPGFGQLYSRVRAVQVSAQGQESFDSETITEADASNWTGTRSRYWALLARPSAACTAMLNVDDLDRPVVKLAGLQANDSTEILFFAGPLDRDVLAADPLLDELLFGSLWEFLRWLCFGMLVLLDLIYGLVGDYGVAIILLSLAVKILMSPLTVIAERWQRDVNRIQTSLRPGLEEIKRKYKGEEAHRLTLDLYRNHGVSPWFTLKSLAGFLLQIPVFIAAFDMLAENFALSGVAFFWIDDLSRPDALLQLPFAMPFFGDTLNLLPFLMTALSLLAAWQHVDESLSSELQREQRRRLYLMSAAFFLLFYTFPAGMVLYWTASNLFHLLRMKFLDPIRQSV